MTVLIVDDEVPLLKNLRGFLTSFEGRFHVLTATSAEEGLQTLEQEEPIDVLLADVRLPGMDGIELIRRARSRRPRLPVVVMSAFGNASVKRKAHTAGALRFLEKPMDLNELLEVLEQSSSPEPGWSGTVGGLDIFDVTQLLAMSGRSLAVRVTFGRRSGLLRFRDGQLVHASAGELEGEDAFFEMARWSGGTFQEVPEKDAATLVPNVAMTLSQLIIEAARRRDEAKREASERGSPAAGESSGDDTQPAVPDPAARPGWNRHDTEEERHMAIKDHLQEFTGIEGFKAAAVFTAQGEILENVTTGKQEVDIKRAGVYANNALLNAQKATDQMGVGRGNLVVVDTPGAIVLMRCLNESTDFATTKAGKAHFHTIVLLDSDGNTGMTKMILEKVVAKIADEIR